MIVQSPVCTVNNGAVKVMIQYDSETKIIAGVVYETTAGQKTPPVISLPGSNVPVSGGPIVVSDLFSFGESVPGPVSTTMLLDEENNELLPPFIIGVNVSLL